MRLFVAIEMPDYVTRAVGKLRCDRREVRWVRLENLHLTLKFIGEVDEERLEPIIEALTDIKIESFLLDVKGVGSFPTRGQPRVMWVGFDRGHPRLFHLQQKVANALISVGLESELRAYHPHLTLARCARASAGSVHEWVKAQRDFEAAPVRVENFGLYSSFLTARGPVHTEEACWALGR